MRARSTAARAVFGALMGVCSEVAASDALPASEYRLRLLDPQAYRLEAEPPQPPSPGAPPWNAKPFAELIDAAARQARLEPALVHAVIHVESRYNPAARSPKGALGLMQVMPATAARYGVRDAAGSVIANLYAGTRYLRDLLDLFGGRLDLALAAYNAGEHAVLRHGGRIPPYRETRQYVPAVLAKYDELRQPPPTPRPAEPEPKRTEYLPGTVLELAPEPRR